MCLLSMGRHSLTKSTVNNKVRHQQLTGKLKKQISTRHYHRQLTTQLTGSNFSGFAEWPAVVEYKKLYSTKSKKPAAKKESFPSFLFSRLVTVFHHLGASHFSLEKHPTFPFHLLVLLLLMLLVHRSNATKRNRSNQS